MRTARTMCGLGVFLVTVVALGWLVSGCADKDGVEIESDVIKAAVEGTNFCLGCALKKQKGAAAQCSIFGHKHALKVTRAVGKELTGMRGWVLHYLETEKSQDLIKQHHGEELTITGKVYPLERELEVDSFKEVVTSK